MPKKNAEIRPFSRFSLVLTTLLVAAYMIYIAQVDREITFPSRRSGPPLTVSWDENPLGYVFCSIPVFITFYGVLLVIRGAWAVAMMILGYLGQAIRRRWIRWAQWKPWRQWWWWPKNRK